MLCEVWYGFSRFDTACWEPRHRPRAGALRSRRHVATRDKEVSSMARRIPVRDILRLGASGLSGNAIARTQSVSKTSVMDTFHAADEKGVSWGDVEQLQDLPGPDLPRHVLPPSLSVAWRAERRRRRCRTGIRLVPNGNIGRWMARCRIAISRVLTSAITQAPPRIIVLLAE